MNITYLVHGFPPFENAGTEQHTALLAREMVDAGHNTTVISATRQPGQLHGVVLSEEWNGISVHRIVNNVPTVPLSSTERRPEIERAITSLIPKDTDLVHIQHTQFLSSQIPFEGPMVWTLHDAWGWCPSGGTLLHNQTHLCKTPSPADCVACYAQWSPQIPTAGHFLIQIAERLSPVISPTTLHRLWKRVPHKLRAPFSIETLPQNIADEKHLHARNDQFSRLAERCEVISPSKFLQDLAHEQGWKNIQNIPHGLLKNPYWNSHIGGGGLLFVGSMVRHKGPQLVSSAYKRAFPNENQPILFVGKGPVSVPHKHIYGVSNNTIYELLQKADALVMGSLWNENYPIILLEAKAVGCPIIAPKCGGIPEIVKDGIDGILYTMGSEKELANAMISIFTEQWDPTPPLSSIDMTNQYIDLYESILERRSE